MKASSRISTRLVVYLFDIASTAMQSIVLRLAGVRRLRVEFLLVGGSAFILINVLRL